MATRMQQRRGTAAQWTAANPTLAAGEIGFETDTSKFKMGNGSSAWTALTYFANAAELAAIIDSAPGTLDTLNELAAALGDDPAFFTTVATNLSNHQSDTTSIHGIADTSVLVTATQLGNHESDTTGVHGITDTSALALTATLNAAIATEVTSRDAAVSTHNSDTTQVHGIADTSALATTADITTHNSDTTGVHGIADTSALTTTTLLNAAIATEVTNRDAAVSTHNSDTTNVHGIADTAALVTTSMLADAITPAALDFAGLAGVGIDWNSGTEALDIDSTVATKTYADGAVSTHDSDTTNVHGIVNTALLATTADVAAVTKTTLGLGNVDNTADTAKPVSTAQTTAIATAKAEAIADATSQVNALLTGAPAALNTLDELAAALGAEEK